MHAGFWRSFLSKYPEINSMQKKMLRTHDKVYRARKSSKTDAGIDELWRGQCNCPYWHGIFGGIYFSHIRYGIYRHLIEAESAADDILFNNKPFIVQEAADFDSDTQKELLVESDDQNIYIDPHAGGSIFEWDLRRPKHNLGAVMTRRDEGYHRDLIEAERIRREGRSSADSGAVKTIHDVVKSKQENLDKLLFYDKYRRASLIDRFLAKDTTTDELLRGSFHENGDFVEKPYEYTLQKKASCITARLARDGHVEQGNDMLPVRVEKTLSAKAGSEGLAITYRLTNTSAARIQSVFTSEWNLAITDDAHSNHCSYISSSSERIRLSRADDIPNTSRLLISDAHIGIDMVLVIDKPARLWRYPVEAVTNSEDGFELTFQGSCYVIGWDVAIEPGQSWEVSMKWQPTNRSDNS